MIILLVLLTSLAGINADCVPAPVPHTETGDDLYRELLRDLANVFAQEAAFVAQLYRNNCTTFQNFDFFTQILITFVGDVDWLTRLMSGTNNPSGSECVAVNTRIDFDVQQVAFHARTTIPGPSCDQLTGTAWAQYALQRHGLAINALAAVPGGSSMVSSYGATSGPVTVGKWQKYVQDLNAGIANLKTVIANNDEANCVTTTRTLGNGLKGLLELITPA